MNDRLSELLSELHALLGNREILVIAAVSDGTWDLLVPAGTTEAAERRILEGALAAQKSGGMLFYKDVDATAEGERKPGMS